MYNSSLKIKIRLTMTPLMLSNKHAYVILDMWMHIVAIFYDNKKALAYAEVLRREAPDSMFTVEEHPII